jgi:APA family basic amino acid/polyamine antiporter
LWIVYGLALCSAIFIIAAITKGHISNLTPMFAHKGNIWVAAPASIISVLVVAPYFMAGFDTISQAAEESGVSMKPQELGLAIMVCIVLGALFYVLIILAMAMSVSSDQLKAIMQAKDVMPTAEVFRVAFGYEWAGQLVLLAALLGLVSTLNGFYIASSRLLFSLGRAGLLPHWFAKLHGKHQTPSNAILFVGGISLLGPFVGQSALVPIVNSGSLTFALSLLMTCLATISLRKSHPDMPRPYRAGAVTIYAGAAVSALVVSLMIIPGSPGLLAPKEFLIIAGWMLFGILGYLLRRRRRDLTRQQQTYLLLGDF